ncbi:MAG: amidohydrolase family protein [Dehalococcoidales bacterium]|nr:amidohydrolase family protein [Dehalococcoidales bacterium]
MIIDFHTHVLPPRVREGRRRYVERDAAFAQIYASPGADIATADDLIESMDRHGVAVSVIVNYGWSTPELCRETNDYILESCARYPERLIGFCAVADFTSDISLRELERCAASGARGIGELRPDLHRADFSDSDAMHPFTSLMKGYGLMLLLHCSEPVGHTYPGKGTATPDLIYPFLERNPALTTICAHWGGGLPFYSLMPEVDKALENVYFDTAASPFLYRPEIYRRVGDFIGVEKILFGSDYPLMEPERLLREFPDTGLTSVQKDLILAGNAQRLLGI